MMQLPRPERRMTSAVAQEPFCQPPIKLATNAAVPGPLWRLPINEVGRPFYTSESDENGKKIAFCNSKAILPKLPCSQSTLSPSFPLSAGARAFQQSAQLQPLAFDLKKRDAAGSNNAFYYFHPDEKRGGARPFFGSGFFGGDGTWKRGEGKDMKIHKK